ncbi:MAG: hypothetical protein HC784_07895 [Hydrococcus sp. CSU_1_8]|nr:hypothetical protein [Hydrococcus sp. CSU_1_8]
MLIGTNLAKVADWSTQLPFIDAFKSSSKAIGRSEQAKKEWGSSQSDFDLKLDWYSKRTTEVMQIWDDVFGAIAKE